MSLLISYTFNKEHKQESSVELLVYFIHTSRLALNSCAKEITRKINEFWVGCALVESGPGELQASFE